MEAEIQTRVEKLFFDALEKPTSERQQFLADACGEDGELRREVAALLAADTDAGEFLESPIPGADSDHPLPGGWNTIDPTVADDHSGAQVGAYRLLRQIGAGGMGVVYLAERMDGSFEQKVAVKLIRRTLDERDILRRFDQERRVLARLEHAGIARLIDGGATPEGHPYLAMEYVDGVPIDRFCTENKLSLHRRLELFRSVCAAVHYAHQNLVVHRDLKPSNILVTPQGEVKLLDFGIAKVLSPDTEAGTETLTHTAAPAQDDMATLTGYRVLTPRYASPEHMRGDPVTTVSDVYSLGVLLYELLTGSPPYRLDRKTGQEALDMIRDKSTTRPSTQTGSRRLAGDLDNIALKALRSDPARRYGSAEQLSEDIHRYLTDLPVQARPDTWRYRTRKFVRRNRAAVVAATAAAVILVVATVGGAVLTVQANRAREAAVVARQEAENQRAAADRINRMLKDMLGSVDPMVAQGRDITLLRELLDDTAKRVERELADQPLVAAELHQTMGETYGSLALFDQAEAQLQAALRLRRQELGAADPLLAESYVSLGELMVDVSRLEDSQSYYRKAYAITVDAYGDRHAKTAVALMYLASIHQAKAEADTAEVLYLRALEMQRELLPSGHEDTAVTLGRYGQFLIHERPEEAGPFLREALAFHRKSSPPLGQTGAMQNLASWLRRHKKAYAESEALFREEIAIFREYLSPDHPQLAVGVNNLAGVLEASGQLDEAEDAYREALSIQTSRLGENHIDVGTTCNNLARLLKTTGAYAESDSLFRRAVTAYEVSLGPEHIWVGIVLGNYAQLLEVQEKWPETDAVAAECVAIRRKVWDEDHWRTASVLGIRAACAVRRGEYAASETVLLRSLDVTESALGPDHAETHLALVRLIDLYRLWGRPEQATVYQTRLSTGS